MEKLLPGWYWLKERGFPEKWVCRILYPDIVDLFFIRGEDNVRLIEHTGTITLDRLLSNDEWELEPILDPVSCEFPEKEIQQVADQMQEERYQKIINKRINT